MFYSRSWAEVGDCTPRPMLCLLLLTGRHLTEPRVHQRRDLSTGRGDKGVHGVSLPSPPAPKKDKKQEGSKYRGRPRGKRVTPWLTRGMPTARVRAALSRSAPGGRTAQPHYRASPTKAPPIGHPRPTSSWLSTLIPRPPCVSACACLSVRRGEHPPRCGISLRSHDTLIHCGVVVVRGRRRRAMACRSNRVCRSVRRPAKQRNRSQARKDLDGRERTRPTAARCEGGDHEHPVPEASLPTFRAVFRHQ